MTKRIIYVLGSCLMVATLLLVSCAGPTPTTTPPTTAPPTTTPATTTPTAGKEMVLDSLGRSVEKPQYGGTVSINLARAISGFDEYYFPPWNCMTLEVTNENLLTGDWLKSDAGTGEFDVTQSGFFPAFEIGNLAESWEFVDPNHIILHIRKGIHWQNKPPVNGRELVAEDVCFSLNRIAKSPASYIAATNPGWHIQATAKDKYTVEWTVNDTKSPTAMAWEYYVEYLRIVAPECDAAPGGLREWKNACGTGPFVLGDYVPDVSATLKRNDSYWGNDPLHPKNQLPYVDGLKMLIIADKSTQLAAMRTGKIDVQSGLSIDDKQAMAATNPQIKWRNAIATAPYMIYMRSDTKPLDDIKVRWALHMSIDLKGLVRDYYMDNAALLWYPIPDWKVFKDAYTPLEQLPQSTRDLFAYNPDKAKQLLAEAGYPKGFKVTVLCEARAGAVDLLSLIKDYWAKIGVELQIDAREYGVWESIGRAGQHPAMYYHWTSGTTLPRKALETKTGNQYNYSIVNDPYINERRVTIWAYENMRNYAVQDRLCKEVALYTLDKCWAIQTPAEYGFTGWQPWIKNYYGAESVGYGNYYYWSKYLWIDQILKKESLGS